MYVPAENSCGQTCPPPTLGTGTEWYLPTQSKDQGWLQTSPSLTALWPKNSQ